MRKFGKIALGTLGAIVGIAVVTSIASGGERPATTAAPSISSAPVAPAAPLTLAPAPTFAAAAPTQAPAVEVPAAATGPLTTFGNGTYEIGVDIAPGKYRSAGVQDSFAPLCYWDTTDANGTIKDQGVANEGPSRATLKKGLTFKSSGCEDWTLQK